PQSSATRPYHVPSYSSSFVLSLHPEPPAAPDLPRRSPLEGMIARAGRGVPGVTVRDDGTLTVEPALVAQALADGIPTAAAPTIAEGAGLLCFLDRVAGRSDPVKLQLTGPVTLGIALVRAGLAPGPAFATAAA